MEIENLKLQKQIDELIDKIYPIGSYYETSDSSFNPNNSWGGTWEIESDGTVLVSECGGSSAGTGRPVVRINDEGGEYWHTLTTNEMPSHSHSLKERFMMWDANATYSVINQYQWKGDIQYDAQDTSFYKTNNTGGGQQFSIMQKYIGVRRWHRTA